MLENATNLTNATFRASEGFLGFLSDYWQELSALITIILVVVGLVFKWVFQKKQHEHEKEMEKIRREYDEKIREKDRENHLRSLLIELKFNKKLADINEKTSYDTSAYERAKETNCLFVLPEELINKINEAQIMLNTARLHDGLYHVEMIDTERLKELYEDIIPDFEEYLKKKYGR